MKLITKIWLTLLLVIAVTLLATAWLTNRSTGQAYRGYFDTFQHYQLVQLANQAGVLYADMGQWQPVQDWLNQTGATMLMPSPQRGRGRGRGAMGLAQGQAQMICWLTQPAVHRWLRTPRPSPKASWTPEKRSWSTA